MKTDESKKIRIRLCGCELISNPTIKGLQASKSRLIQKISPGFTVYEKDGRIETDGMVDTSNLVRIQVYNILIDYHIDNIVRAYRLDRADIMLTTI